jgi:S-adenosylmethionine:tRNA ribosyltransferase-isomerase
MKVADFDFDLPPDRIAVRPAEPRESARLLRITAEGLEDRSIGDLPDLLRPGDLLVVNDTKVIPARLVGRIGEGRVEVNLIRVVDECTWECLARPGKRFRPGSTAVFGDLTAQIVAKAEDGTITLSFNAAGAALMAALERVGTMPLPPYIARKREPDDQDRTDYQTAFADRTGAVAAPTAGLHLTPAMLGRLEALGVERVAVTLHVGAGTFLPVKVDDTADHVMHFESGVLESETAAALNAVRARGGRIVAVGTTSLRILESACDAAGRLAPWAGATDIFITPGRRVRSIDALMTNFHLPRSTLFMLVSAFSGLERMRSAYAHAIGRGYRFYSYGDASLLFPDAT